MTRWQALVYVSPLIILGVLGLYLTVRLIPMKVRLALWVVVLVLIAVSFLPLHAQLNCSGGWIGCLSITANLSNNAGSLDTVQGIQTSSTPQFAGLGVNVASGAAGSVTTSVSSGESFYNLNNTSAGGRNWKFISTGNSATLGSANRLTVRDDTGGAFAAQWGAGGTFFLPNLTAESGTKAALCEDTTTKEVQVNTGVATCTVSSLDFKRKIREMTCKEANRIVKSMKPGVYRDKDGHDSSRFGFDAESTSKVEPMLVDYVKGKPRAVDYERYSAVLTKYLQCLNP